jgi:hypothetical protein
VTRKTYDAYLDFPDSQKLIGSYATADEAKRSARRWADRCVVKTYQDPGLQGPYYVCLECPDGQRILLGSGMTPDDALADIKAFGVRIDKPELSK